MKAKLSFMLKLIAKGKKLHKYAKASSNTCLKNGELSTINVKVK